MTRIIYTLLLFLLSASASVAQTALENAFPALSFNRPVDLQHAGDGSNRLFVVEQAGKIHVFRNDPAVANASVFLDITARVNDEGNEEGLLGLAFHPSYENNGYFYVNYTASSPRRTVISRFQVSTSDPDVANPESETVILEFDQPYSNHNGGQIVFGPDGYLYIGTGDGGSGGDPQNNAQNRSRLLGKMLRIDIDNTSPGNAYAIPGDNPYVDNTAGFREEIWAYGLRNPWRFSFDPVTGRLWAGDVGQNRFEEIDIIEKGKNYGWRVMEGFVCFNPSSGCDQTGIEKPVVTYGRSLGISVTGGHLYRGKSVPELAGLYLYADFGSGNLWTLHYVSPDQATNALLLPTGQNISSFGIDEANETYLCTFGGEILRFKPSVTGLEALPLPSAPAIEDIHPQPAVLSKHTSLQLRFGLPAVTTIKVQLYDTLGREIMIIADGKYDAGKHIVSMDIGALRPGLYFLALSTTESRVTKKLLVLE